MILRIEDTDQTRYVPGAEEYILQSLAWVGIKIDEGLALEALMLHTASQNANRCTCNMRSNYR